MDEKETKSVFDTLNAINVSDKVEKKNGMSYLSWAYAWAEVKKRYPNATYTIYEREDGTFYFTDGKTCWVKTGVTINGLEHIEYLPVMDNRNRSITLDNVTSFDVNKSIQRSLTKALARHGLGLYIYAGEDLPEDMDSAPVSPAKELVKCSVCGKPIVPTNGYSAEKIIAVTTARYKKPVCFSCSSNMKNEHKAEEHNHEKENNENA